MSAATVPLSELDHIPFEKKPDALPDREGTLTRPGDWIRAKDGTEWQVESLHVTEAYSPGNLRNKLGTISREYSYFRVVQHRYHGSGEFFALSGTVHWSSPISDSLRLDLSPEELRARELAKLDVMISNCNVRIADVENERRRAMTARELLLQRREG